MISTRIPPTGRPTQTPGPAVGLVAGRAEDLVAADRGDRQRLGRPVRSEDLDARREQLGERLQHRGRHRRPGRDHPPERRQPHAALAPASPTRRSKAGEPNRFVTPKASIASKILVGSTCPGRVASISGMIAVIPSAGANRANSGKVQRSISPGCDPVEVAEDRHLRGEDRVGVDRPLGRSRAAAGEEDRRGLVGLRAGDRIGFAE